MGKHAILSASGSHRWLACPPSAQLEATLPGETSEYAEEGRLAHEIGELMIRKYLGQINTRSLNVTLKKLKKSHFYSEPMLEHLDAYVALAAARIAEAKTHCTDPVVMLEQRLDFSPWVPAGFGTGDLVIISDGILEVCDLKYGKGVPVSAERNSQMMLYALGAVREYDLLYDFDLVRMTICQPRLDSVSSYEMTVTDLILWAENVLVPRAKLAWEGDGEFCAGEHCRFCRAKATCRARADENLQLAAEDFYQKPGPELSIEEIAQVLARAEEIKKWASDIQEHALDQAANHGIDFPGWKLVAGRSNRVYRDKDLVAQTLKNAGLEEASIYKPIELLGITDMEKSITKKRFKELLETEKDPLVIKPEGRPTLVPETDKRPALERNTAAEDFATELPQSA